LVLSIFSSVLLYLFYQKSLTQLDKTLITIIAELDKQNLKNIERFDINNLHIAIYKYNNKNFKKVFSTSSNTNFKKIKDINFEAFSTEKFRVIRQKSKNEEHLFIEVATTIDDKVQNPYNYLKEILIYLVPFLFVLSSFISYLLIISSLKPVKKIINEVKKIESTNLKQRLTSYTNNDEIGELVKTFNMLLEKLDKSFEKIEQFSKDVSHELKTPLTILRGEIEVALNKNRDIQEYKKILNLILQEVISLQNIIEKLLFFSKLNNEDIKKSFQEIEIDEVIIDIINSYKQQLNNKNLKIEFINLENVKILGELSLIKILISNILQNAIKFSKKDSKIEIDLTKNFLKIKDYGIGIEANKKDKIFDKFYQIDNSRNNDGVGLGLSIVKTIAKLHNFDIKVESKIDKFTIFTIFFK
jgi:signal transduction histidine kinase